MIKEASRLKKMFKRCIPMYWIKQMISTSLHSTPHPHTGVLHTGRISGVWTDTFFSLGSENKVGVQISTNIVEKIAERESFNKVLVIIQY